VFVAILLDQEATMGLWGARIVAIADGTPHITMVTSLLRDAGADIISVSHPGEALATITGVMPDLVVVEAEMAGVDSRALMRKVRTLSPEKGGRVPALTLCASTLCSERRAEWRKAGFQACMAKPFHAEEVLELADRLTGAFVERRRTDHGDHRRVFGGEWERRHEQRFGERCLILDGYPNVQYLLI
jgi:CheY-like chemotaxis protein